MLQPDDVLWLLIWGDEAFPSLMSNLNAGIYSVCLGSKCRIFSLLWSAEPNWFDFFFNFSFFHWLKVTLVSETDTVMPFSLPVFWPSPSPVLPPFLYLMLCCCLLSFFGSCSISSLFQFFHPFLLYSTEAQTSFQKTVRQQMPHGTAESHMTLGCQNIGWA